MNILEQIVKDKREEIRLKKEVLPASSLESYLLFESDTYSLSSALRRAGSSGIIAEHKRRSPSKSVINQSLSVQEVALSYQKAGVAGMSVLTDGKYFGGSLDDLLLVRASVELPLLRKEFIIDPYQVLEAKAHGADAILLIAAVLGKAEIKALSDVAKKLGLEVLLEVHNEEELQESMMPGIDMIGVNNRNLKTFKVDLETSKTLSDKIPSDFTKVSESGISSAEAIKDLKGFGFQGFLIGEHFMASGDPGQSAVNFINELNR